MVDGIPLIRRHHNLLTLQGKPNMTGPIQKGGKGGSTVGKGHGKGNGAAQSEPAFWARTTRVNMNTSTGNQDIQISGLTWTPKAARFTFLQSAMDQQEDTSSGGSIGVTDGTNQWATGWSNEFTATGGRRVAIPDGVIASIDEDSGYAIDAEANFVSWLEGGVRINISNAPAAGDFLVVEFFGGTSLNAAVGRFDLPAQDATTTVTPDFESNLIFFGLVTSVSGDFDGVLESGSTLYQGFASYDGSTILQAAATHAVGAVSPRATTGQIRNNAMMTHPNDTRYAELSSVNSTQFGVTMRNGAFGGNEVGYLALGFGGGAEAYVTVDDFPTATGTDDLGAASFTPSYATLHGTGFTALATSQTSGEAWAWANSMIDGTREYSMNWTSTDAAGSGGTTDDINTTDDQAVYLPDHRRQNIIEAAFDSWQSGAVRLDYAAVRGAASKVVTVLVG